MLVNEQILPHGYVFGVIKYMDGSEKHIEFKNTVLRKGREALARGLANDIGESFNFFVSRMIFGDGGTQGGQLKYVTTDRNGLFGITRAVKPVIASLDLVTPTQVIFTSVISFSEANGYTLNEMALQMNNGDLYSMITFPDLSKTAQMQITWSWRQSYC